MFPGGANPKQMKAMLKRMGIKMEEVDATRVVIEGVNEKIIINNPQVMITKMPNQEMFQISGDVVREDADDVEVEIEDDDVSMVAEQTGASEDDARTALEGCNGDIAEAIMKLKG